MCVRTDENREVFFLYRLSRPGAVRREGKPELLKKVAESHFFDALQAGTGENLFRFFVLFKKFCGYKPQN